MLTQNSAVIAESHYRILVVDDNDHHRKMQQLALSELGHHVYETSNGCDALEYIKEHDIDVVLLDLDMPDMDGNEVCRQVRTTLGKTLLPIIMLTGDTNPKSLVMSMYAGANDFIHKPCDQMELIARLDAAAGYKRITDQLDSAESLLFALARMVEAKDEYTGDHCSRLAHMGTVFGKSLGLCDEDIIALRRGGILHDIGKLGIPDSILLKRGKLNDEEWTIMRQHTVIGAKLCMNLQSMKRTIPIIKHHHERWDGGGYPEGLKGEDIPYLARIFQIIDIFDALSSARPYKEALPQKQVLEIMLDETRKGWRDPELMRTFVDFVLAHPDQLLWSEDSTNDPGLMIYEDIKATGALSYG